MIDVSNDFWAKLGGLMGNEKGMGWRCCDSG